MNVNKLQQSILIFSLISFARGKKAPPHSMMIQFRNIPASFTFHKEARSALPLRNRSDLWNMSLHKMFRKRIKNHAT